MNKKKILFLIHALGSGGAEKVLIDLISNLDKEQFDITVMTVLDTGPLRGQIPSNINYKSIFRLSRKPMANSSLETKDNVLTKNSALICTMKKIYSLFWKFVPCKIIHNFFIGNSYDIEIAFLEGIPSKIISASSNKSSKKYCWIHVDLLNEKKSDVFFRNKKSMYNVYSKFDKIVCVSNTVKKSFLERFNIDSDKVAVRHNPIDSDKIILLSDKKIDLPYEKNIFNICSVGRLCNQKGYDRLVKVVAELVKSNKNFCVYIIGEGPDKFKLLEAIKNYKVDSYIKLLGYQENPYPYLKKSDLFVCSSRAEGYSTVATEATILGIPAVVTNCSGMDEIYENGKYGLIVENSEEGIFKGLSLIINSEEKYNFFKSQIQLRKNSFNMKYLIESIEELLLTE